MPSGTPLSVDSFNVPCQLCPAGQASEFSRLFNPALERPSDPMDPFSLSTGIMCLIAVALSLVVGALGMTDKTVAAYYMTKLQMSFWAAAGPRATSNSDAQRP